MLFVLILIRLLTDLVDGPAFLIFGMASSEIRLMTIFFIGYYIPALINLKEATKQPFKSTHHIFTLTLISASLARLTAKLFHHEFMRGWTELI